MTHPNGLTGILDRHDHTSNLLSLFLQRQMLEKYIPEASLHGGGQETLRLYEKWKSKQCEGRSDWSQLRNYQPHVVPPLFCLRYISISFMVPDHAHRFSVHVFKITSSGLKSCFVLFLFKKKNVDYPQIMLKKYFLKCT